MRTWDRLRLCICIYGLKLVNIMQIIHVMLVFRRLQIVCVCVFVQDENPLYKQATSTFQNPTYGKKWSIRVTGVKCALLFDWMITGVKYKNDDLASDSHLWCLWTRLFSVFGCRMSAVVFELGQCNFLIFCLLWRGLLLLIVFLIDNFYVECKFHAENYYAFIVYI